MIKSKSRIKWASGFLLLLIFAVASACGNPAAPASNQPSSGDHAAPESGAAPTHESPDEAAQNNALKTNLSIASPPIGSSYNASASGIASIVSQHSELRLSVKPFAGVPAWGPLLDKGEVDLGLAAMPEEVWAFHGTNGFEPLKNQRMLVRGNFINNTGPVVRKDSGIHSIADLKGKRVASDFPAGPNTKALMEATFAANDMSYDDVRKVPIPTTVAGIEAIRDDRVDASSMMTPTTPIIVETHNAVGLRALHFLDNVEPNSDNLQQVPQKTKDLIRSHMPGAELTVVQPEGFITEPTIAIRYPTAMVASAHLNDETAYEIVKTLFEHYEKLHPIHAWLSEYTPERMFDPNPPLPYHPGAVKFYKEKGLWTDELEKIQQDNLNAAK